MTLSNDLKESNLSVLGKDLFIKGELHLSGMVRLSSRIEGTIIMKNQGELIIERRAIIHGHLFCHNLELFGQFYGSITATGTLIIRSSAKFSGKLTAKTLSIYPGSIVNMECIPQAD